MILTDNKFEFYFPQSYEVLNVYRTDSEFSEYPLTFEKIRKDTKLRDTFLSFNIQKCEELRTYSLVKRQKKKNQ